MPEDTAAQTVLGLAKQRTYLWKCEGSKSPNATAGFTTEIYVVPCSPCISFFMVSYIFWVANQLLPSDTYFYIPRSSQWESWKHCQPLTITLVNSPSLRRLMCCLHLWSNFIFFKSSAPNSYLILNPHHLEKSPVTQTEINDLRGYSCCTTQLSLFPLPFQIFNYLISHISTH